MGASGFSSLHSDQAGNDPIAGLHQKIRGSRARWRPAVDVADPAMRPLYLCATADGCLACGHARWSFGHWPKTCRLLGHRYEKWRAKTGGMTRANPAWGGLWIAAASGHHHGFATLVVDSPGSASRGIPLCAGHRTRLLRPLRHPRAEARLTSQGRDLRRALTVSVLLAAACQDDPVKWLGCCAGGHCPSGCCARSGHRIAESSSGCCRRGRFPAPS